MTLSQKNDGVGGIVEGEGEGEGGGGGGGRDDI